MTRCFAFLQQAIKTNEAVRTVGQLQNQKFLSTTESSNPSLFI